VPKVTVNCEYVFPKLKCDHSFSLHLRTHRDHHSRYCKKAHLREIQVTSVVWPLCAETQITYQPKVQRG